MTQREHAECALMAAAEVESMLYENEISAKEAAVHEAAERAEAEAKEDREDLSNARLEDVLQKLKLLRAEHPFVLLKFVPIKQRRELRQLKHASWVEKLLL